MMNVKTICSFSTSTVHGEDLKLYLFLHTRRKTICLNHLISMCREFAWQRRTSCTCQRCGAHLYSNLQLRPMPTARGGDCAI